MNRTFHPVLSLAAGAAAILFLTNAARAAETVEMIDDFETGLQASVTLTSSPEGSSAHRNRRGEMAGGHRDVNFTITADTGMPDTVSGRKGSYEISGGKLIMETGVDVLHALDLAWGYAPSGFVPLNMDVDGILATGTFRINFKAVDSFINVTVSLITADGADTFVAADNFGASLLPHSLELPLASFVSGVTEEPVGPGDLVDVDRILLSIHSGGQSCDLAIDSIDFAD